MKKRRVYPLLTALIVTTITVLLTMIGHSFIREALAQPAMLATAHDIYGKNSTAFKDYIEYKVEPNLLDEDVRYEEVAAIPTFTLVDQSIRDIPKGMVALTFDDGPSAFTTDIVDTLVAYDAGATFFLIGEHIKNYPGNVEYIHQHGFSIGTHSMNHINLAESSWATQQYEIQQSSEMLQAIIGEEITLFRPPFGQFNDVTKTVFTDLGQKMVLWNNDPKDWQSLDAKKIIEHITSSEVSGSIIILHENAATLEALPEIIAYLKEQDLQLVTLH